MHPPPLTPDLALGLPTSDLARQYRLFSAAVSAHEDFFYVFDRGGRFVFANKALCDLLQRTPEEMVGKTFFDLKYPDDLAATLQRQIQEVIDTKDKVRAETPFTSPAGHLGVYEYIFCPVFDANGDVEVVTGTTRDITAQADTRRQLDQAILALASKATRAEANYLELQRLFEQSPGFMAVLRGKDHVISMCNSAYLSLVNNRDVLGKPVAVALPEIVAQGFTALLDEVRETGVPYVGRSTPFHLRGASDGLLIEQWVDFVYQPIFDESRRVVGIFVQGSEVSEQYHTRQKLIEADRQKDQFIATLAHELRNPLAPIRTAARLLELPDVTADSIAATTGIISRQVAQMARLLDDLLDVSRITNNQLRLQKEFVKTDALIAMALEATRPMIDAKQHRVTLANGDGSIEVHVDPVRITQVISNLLGNAAKYTDQGGAISITTSLRGDGCAIVVEDNGIGISKSAMGSVFSMFAQEQSVIDRSDGGLGIGLALVKGLVELHGGTVVAESEGPGRGSRFTIELPISTVRESATDSNPSNAGTPNTGKRKKILVADDNVDSVSMLAAFMDMLGHDVVCAYTGTEAFDLAETEHPDIAILDIGMQGLNGYQLAEQIRAQAWGAGMLLIAATGWGNEEDKQRTRSAGFDVHLTKPFSMDALEGLLAAQS